LYGAATQGVPAIEGGLTMKRVTRNNLLKLIDMMKDYEEQEEKDKQLLQQINNFIDNVINKDKRYYNKLNKYGFTNEQLKYLI